MKLSERQNEDVLPPRLQDVFNILCVTHFTLMIHLNGISNINSLLRSLCESGRSVICTTLGALRLVTELKGVCGDKAATMLS